MKLPPKFQTNRRPVQLAAGGDEILPDLKVSRHRCRQAIEQVKGVVLERGTELDALLLCLVTRQHMLLEGPHGIAKSMLAEEVFRRVVGANVYEKMMMVGTQPEEIFGPMNARLYRQKGVWKHTTTGFLPEAHFGFVDEVYRAGDTLLGSMLNIMHERKFINGSTVQRCPLITLIGTTNFVTESPALEAFHDRWTVRSKLKPLGAPNLRVQMLRNYHQRLLALEGGEELATFSLLDLQTIQTHLSDVEVEPSMFELYENLVREYARNLGKATVVSDRGLNLGFKLCLAATLMDVDEKHPNRVQKLDPKHLHAAHYAVCMLHDETQTQPFDRAYDSVVGTAIRNYQETSEMEETRKLVNKLTSQFDEDMGPKKALNLYKLSEEITESIEAILSSGTRAPKQPRVVESYETFRRDLAQVVLSIIELPYMKQPLDAFRQSKQGGPSFPNSGPDPVSSADPIATKGKVKPF